MLIAERNYDPFLVTFVKAPQPVDDKQIDARGNSIESPNTKLALFGSTNEWARTNLL